MNIHLDPGIYLNVFPISIPQNAFEIMKAPRGLFSNLQQLRQKLEGLGKKAWLYVDKDVVYSYGSDAGVLEKEGFQKTYLRLTTAPKLATHIITKGIVNTLIKDGYKTIPRKARLQLYHPNQFSKVADGNVRIYRGYDLRSIFWKDAATRQITFGLIVDVIWILRDSSNKPINMYKIRKQYGYQAVITIGQIQGEYLPNSNRINSEVARQRFRDHILPFVRRYSEFDLPWGGQARILPEPVRVILEDGKQ